MSASTHYLDHAAATPLDERVLSVMQPYLSDIFYNPSASYEGGRRARAGLEEARHTIGLLLGAKPHDIVFTAGATESIHLALRGILSGGGHAVMGGTEHAAVRATIDAYPHSIATPDSKGIITAEAVRAVLRDDTVLITIALADSEFGTVQPLQAITALVENERRRRRAEGNTTPLVLHTDASQAAVSLDLKVSRLGVDMMTLNAAKCYGPKQIGLLWLKSSVRLTPLLVGGGQERGLRSGTENVAGAVGFAKALELVQKGRHSENERLLSMRNELETRLKERLADVVIDGHPKRHLPGHLHIHCDGLDAERVVFRLDMQGVAIATGAACAANKETRSPALEAVGLTPSEADGSLRISLGHLNKQEDVEAIADLLCAAIEQERGL